MNYSNSDKIKEYLINNKHVFSAMFDEFLLQETINNEHPVFEDLIKQEYFDKIKVQIIDELVKVLNVSAEECHMELDDLNLKEYLK